MYKEGNAEKSRIFLLATIYRINIIWGNIHTGLGIIVGGKMYPLNDRQKTALLNRLSELRFLIIDEISMVSNVLLYQVYQRLSKIFQCESDLSFAG